MVEGGKKEAEAKYNKQVQQAILIALSSQPFRIILFIKNVAREATLINFLP
jgi:hypothetical protein